MTKWATLEIGYQGLEIDYSKPKTKFGIALIPKTAILF
jgi:hypothetical protein